jgi:hypothetical protein
MIPSLMRYSLFSAPGAAHFKLTKRHKLDLLKCTAPYQHLHLDPTPNFDYTRRTLPEWRNWQTRTTQNRVPSGVRVQFPPSAQEIIVENTG